jgi:hypothetical protein
MSQVSHRRKNIILPFKRDHHLLLSYERMARYSCRYAGTTHERKAQVTKKRIHVAHHVGSWGLSDVSSWTSRPVAAVLSSGT